MSEPDDPKRRLAEGMAKVGKGDGSGWSDVLDALVSAAASDPEPPPLPGPPPEPRRYQIFQRPKDASAPDVSTARGEPGPPCWWCGQPSELLCDSVLVGDSRIDGWERMTCDAEMCASCVAASGKMFMCIAGKLDIDTMDTCPYCADLRARGDHSGLRPAPEADLDAAKAHVHGHRSRAREHGRTRQIQIRRDALVVARAPDDPAIARDILDP